MHFSLSLPTLDPSEERFQKTLDSVLKQSALSSPATSLSIFVVSPESISDEQMRSWVGDRSNVSITSVRDQGRGLYAALAASFALHTGDANSYLGAGDVLEPQTLKLVAEGMVLGDQATTAWLTGQIVTRRSDGAIVRTTLPPPYSRKGLIRGRYTRLAPSIQQESTWWSRGLHERIPLSEFARWQLAGDFFLWRTFAESSAPVVLDAVLGSFTWHGDNMSQDWDAYLTEIEEMCGPLTAWDRVYAYGYQAMWALPNHLKWKLFRGRVYRWAWPDGPWV